MTSVSVTKRRKELATRVIKGEIAAEVAEDIADKYGVTAQRIKNDWSHRDEWLDEVFDMEDPEQMVEDILAEEILIREHLWDLVENSENDNARKGALKELKNLNSEIVELMQSLGRVEKEPDKQEVEVSGDKFSINVEESDGDGDEEDD